MPKEKDTEKTQKRIIALLVVLLLLLAMAFGALYMKKDNKTAVLETTQTQLQDPDETGDIRVILNSTISVDDNDTMQNINFENANERRLLKCKIKLEGEKDYVYESQYLESGKIIKADLLDKGIESGTHNALAEIYSYNENKEKIGQVNVKITLNK